MPVADVQPNQPSAVLAMKGTGHRTIVRWLQHLDRRGAPTAIFEDLEWSAFTGARDDRSQTLVVLRDLPNLLASRMAGGESVGQDVVRAWCSHVQAALDAVPGGPTVFVDYPAWYASPVYRSRLATRLGRRPGSEQGSPVGAPHPSESPWEKWREYALDPEWREICLHPDLRALSGSRFGDPLIGL